MFKHIYDSYISECERDKAEKKYENYKPNNPDDLKEFFDIAKSLGVVVAIRTKNQVYIRVNSSGIFTPPEIVVLLTKFNFNCRVGSTDHRSSIYYANARRHAIEIYEVKE